MTITVENGNYYDVAMVTQLAMSMHGESRYKKMAFSVTKFSDFLTGCVGNEDILFLVARDKKEIVGGFLGYVMEHFFSNDIYSGDFGLYVTPGSRGKFAAIEMIRHYSIWAEEKGVLPEYIGLGISTGIKPERTALLYTSLGFHRIGSLHARAV